MPSASSLHRKEVMSLDFSETSGFRPEPAVSKFYRKPLTYQSLTTMINTDYIYKVYEGNVGSNSLSSSHLEVRGDIPIFRQGRWIPNIKLGGDFQAKVKETILQSKVTKDI